MPEWLNEQSMDILRSKYLQTGESYDEAVDRISTHASQLLKKPSFKRSIEEAIHMGWLGLASPIWANFGAERGLPISCYGMTIADSVDSIADKTKEVMVQTKLGGGTSGYFGKLRGRGDRINDGGFSNGSVSFMKIFDSVIDVISQGNVRRGAFAAYLDAEHKDIMEFLNIRGVGSSIQNILTGVCCSDSFMRKVVDGDSYSRKVWAKILQSRLHSGVPYIFFTDNVNKYKPLSYSDRKITHSNLCVKGDTEIMTDKGRFKIEELAGERANIWNGFAFSPVDVLKTGENQELVKVTTSRGQVLECTKYHKFYVYDKHKSLVKIEAQELEKGMEIITYQLPILNDKVDDNIKWLTALIKKYGQVKGRNIILLNDNELILRKWMLRIQELGCHSYISKSSTGGKALFIQHDSVPLLKRLGLNLKDYNGKSKFIVTPFSSATYIESVEEVAGTHDTYCFTELKRGMGLFNGILTGQCSEILLPDTTEESFVCCLSSLNLDKYEEWKDKDVVQTAIYFLDAVMQDFINKSQHIKGMESSYRFAKNHRALGLGVLGYHSLLQRKMIPFDSDEAAAVNKTIFKDISEKALLATIELAKEYGSCEVARQKGFRRRNTTTTAIAPTTNNSAILGQVSPGIEPIKSNYYIAGLNDKSHVRKNKYLTKLLEERGVNSQLVWDNILNNNGSVRNVTYLSSYEKKVFATFQEINQEAIIQQAVDRQQYIDQGQSLNLLIHYNTSVKEINRLYIDAWKKGIKTIYYQRGVSMSKENISCQSCQS